MLLAALLFAVAVQSGDVVTVESGSPGLVPSMKSNYVNVYGPDLRFRSTAVGYPKLEVTPTAAIVSGESVIVAEGRFDGTKTVTTIVRHAPDGTATSMGPAMTDSVVAFAFGSGGDLFAATSAGFIRLNAVNGDVRARSSLPAGVVGPITDFDFDVNGCDAAIATPHRLMTANLCSDELQVMSLPISPRSDDWFSGVRFAPNGDLIVGSRNRFYRVDRSGTQRWVTALPPVSTWTCKAAIVPDLEKAVAICGFQLSHLHLATGTMSLPFQVQYGVYVYTIAIRDEWRAAGPRLRRRVVPH